MANTEKSQPRIVLYGAPPSFGLPCLSPYVMKSWVQLKMMGLDFTVDDHSIVAMMAEGKLRKGRMPVIMDGDTLVEDSHFIRLYLEKKYGKDLDEGLSDLQKATAWSAERTAEDSLHYAINYQLWFVDKNFEIGAAHFFDALPVEIRDSVLQAQRKKQLDHLYAQGISRHSPDEILDIVQRGYSALSQLLGHKDFLLGDRPYGSDASIFGQLATAMCEHFNTPLRHAILSHPNLVRYHDRMMRMFFPDFAKSA
ncbi:hypothetical protein F5Y16DRAFT_396850 [Xylariaceae sp. FL0255]|nr:hypothetical protein F5Y16DRAFT_396850 [Xylariaceae sp. FL0255]